MPATTQAPASYALTAQQASKFREDGFLGPLTLCEPGEMAAIRERLEREVFCTDGPAGGNNPRGQCRNLDKRVVYDLCAQPAIVESMASLYGPDLILWRSNFFWKEPGDKEIPWHQDFNSWPLEPVINISAWLAIDPASVENSCVQIIPGTHKRPVPHIDATPEMAFRQMADPRHFDASAAVNMELQPGQFFLFNERTLHHSEPNRSNRNRRGLAVRVTIPIVKVDHRRLYPGHKCMLLRGADRMGLNEMAEPPLA